ncbi:iron-sulfur cluster repair di-iron protein [Clostridium sp.]|uniref:iron-sulfur cluster repair di-iron protein n=1 Tax=Clostridium sp. TaxID=1506 RepID=UPI003464C51F
MFNKEDNLGYIVANFMDSAKIFNKYHIDYCCNGNRSLIKSCEEQGINPDKLLEEINLEYLEALQGDAPLKTFIEFKSDDLIDHINNTHHKYTRDEVVEIEALINKILRVHYDNHGKMLEEVREKFLLLKEDILGHLEKEEESIFPLMNEYMKNKDISTLLRIRELIGEGHEEHDTAGNILKDIRNITNNYNIDSSMCTTFKLTYSKLVALEEDLFTHIHKEESILFPRYL